MYALLNIKWGESTYGTPSGVVTWSEDLADLPTASGTSTGDYVTALQAAFKAWEDVAAITFQQTNGAADIEIDTASFSTDSPSDNDGALAVTRWISTSAELYEPNDVRIDFNSDSQWSPFDDSDPETFNFYAVAVHEIGHTLGLAHVDDTSEIMNEFIATDELGNGDKAGAQAIYGLDEDDEPAQGEEVSASESLAESGGGGGGGGIILGLLALIVGLFTGGAGAVSMMAAAKAARGDDDLAHEGEDDHLGEDGHHHAPGFHALLPAIPVEEFEHTRSHDEEESDDFVLF